MKKGIVIGVLLCLFLGAAKPPKFWRDLLAKQIKPTQEWHELYGYGDTSWLAHNAWVQKQLLDGQGAVIASMKKDIDELRDMVVAIDPPDPNEVDE